MKVKSYNEFVQNNGSQLDEKMKVMLDKITSKMVSGAFGATSDAKMREELKAKIEAGVRETLLKYDYVVESRKSDQLAREIDRAMIRIDDSMGYEDFALAVAKILQDEYGAHNFGNFMKVLHKELGM